MSLVLISILRKEVFNFFNMIIGVRTNWKDFIVAGEVDPSLKLYQTSLAFFLKVLKNCQILNMQIGTM